MEPASPTANPSPSFASILPVVDLIERLERKIRRRALAAMPKDAGGELAAMELRELLYVYGNWRNRFVAARPRNVHLSRELTEKRKQGNLEPMLGEVIAKIESGVELKPHLSRGVNVAYESNPAKQHHRRQDLDLLLAEWGVHHLHLSGEVKSDGFVERTRDLIFAFFTAEDAYLIDIYPHGSWAKKEVLETVVRNWPATDLLQSSSYVVGLSQERSEDEAQAVRNAGISSPVEIDGKVYSPQGQTLGGAPLRVASQVNALMWALRDWREKADERLYGHDDGGFSYWLPAVRQQQCGFASGEKFVPIGRLP